MNQLDWLCQHRFLDATRREYDWLFTFDGQASLVVECLWRLVKDNRIRLTNLDDGQRFGLPAPVDAAVAIKSRLENALIDAVTLRSGTLDLQLAFSNGHTLEIIPDSSGYEAWNLLGVDQQFVACAAGDLAVFNYNSKNREGQSDAREPQ